MEQTIKDNCDYLSDRIIRTYGVFIDICKPITDEQFEILAYDAMEMWGC